MYPQVHCICEGFRCAGTQYVWENARRLTENSFVQLTTFEGPGIYLLQS